MNFTKEKSDQSADLQEVAEILASWVVRAIDGDEQYDGKIDRMIIENNNLNFTNKTINDKGDSIPRSIKSQNIESRDPVE